MCYKMNVQISEIEENGRYIRLLNVSKVGQSEEIGRNILAQSFGGRVVYAFQFPSRVQIPADHCITVWSAEATRDRPKTEIERFITGDPRWNFQFRELLRWSSNPNYTTTLTRANGMVIATSDPELACLAEEPVAPCGIHKYSLNMKKPRLPPSQKELVDIVKKAQSGFKPRCIICHCEPTPLSPPVIRICQVQCCPVSEVCHH